MSTDLSKAYELLGVKPGVSNRDLKAAHRDLAKVWHPDRFQHDPRLQMKAQEKLKEINEAYVLLLSGKVPRPITPPARAYSPIDFATRPRTSHSFKSIAVMLVFFAVFAVTIRISMKQRAQPVAEPEVAQPVHVDGEAATRSDSRTRADATRKVTRDNAEPEVEATTTPIETQPAAVETVTVTIDPESGLLAKSDCPVRSRMTYPRGAAPTAHCTINHTPPPKESRIKSIAEKILR